MNNKSFKNEFAFAFSFTRTDTIPFINADQMGQRTFFKGSTSDDKSEETIEANRRRKSEGPSGRAEAPRRRQDRAGTTPSGTSGSGGYSSFGGGGSSLGGKRIPTWMIVVAVIFFIVYYLFFGGKDQFEQQNALENTPGWSDAADTMQEIEEPAMETSPEAAVEIMPEAPAAQAPAPAGSTGKTWTVMLYQDADDEVLEQDIMLDLNEAERVGSSDNVQIVAQFDRYRGGYQGDQNWTSARRYYVTKDNDLQHIKSQLIADLGEVNMADANTLVDFATWAIKTYPADKYALILSDHGMGWPGGWSDQDSGKARKSNIPLVRTAGNQMYLMEIDKALGEIRSQTGVDKFELVGLDACLMSDVEVYSALAPHARYAVASQEVEPGLGWAYTGFLKTLSSNPEMTGADLGRQIVKSYIAADQRILDDQARADFLRQGSPLSGLFGFNDVNPDELVQQVERSVTLTAVDLSAMPTVMDRLNNLSYALQSENQFQVARARTYAQNFTSVFGDNVPPSYIDLGSFMQILQREGSNAGVQDAIKQLQASLKQLIVAEKHGSDKHGASGVSIYFPNSKLYSAPEAGPSSYNAIAQRFVGQSTWDDFLAFHYTQRTFEPAANEAVEPAAGSRVRAPGTGVIDVSPLTLSSTEAAPDEPVTMSAKLSGLNIGYVYLFVGYFDAASNSIMVADTDYLESPKTQEVDGVYYPQWSDSESFNLQYEWNPTVFAIADGQKTVTAVFNPESYGASAKDAVYSVNGYYTISASGDTYFAKLYFRDGKLEQVFTFTGEEQTGAPHEISPQDGDMFTVQEKWLDPTSSGEFSEATQKGGTLTFGEQPFTWEELYAAPGEYVAGFIVTDLDGNSQGTYGKLTVR